MTVYTSKQAAPGRQPNATGWAGQQMTAVGTVIFDVTRGTAPVTSGPLNGDVYRMVKLPKGAMVVGGRVFGSRIASGTSSGSTTMTLNIGLSGPFKDSDGTSYGATTASQAFGATIGQDYSETTVGSVKYESGANYDLGGLLLTLGPILLTEEQYAQISFVGSATSFISGSQISLKIDYYMAQQS